MTATPRGELLVFDDPVSAAHAAAERFVAAARRVLADRDVFRVALAGGSTPRAAYEILAQRYLEWVEWRRVEIYFGDERCVPPDHRDSNYRMAREALLDHVPLGADRVHRMAGERDPEEAARAYTGRLPLRFDLVLLGLGADGHTASLLPGSPVLDDRTPRCAPVHPEGPSDWRLTLTAPVFSAASEVLVLATGAEKATPLALALKGPDGILPIQLIRPASGLMSWVVDLACASALSDKET